MEKKLLEIVYQKYHREIYLYLYSFCRNHHLTEDLLQETFLKAILSLPNTHSNIRAWLYMVARNLYLNYRKKNEKKQLLEDVDTLSDTAGENDVFDGIFNKEVFSLRVFGELSFKQIAELFGKSEHWACVTFHRAKEMIRGGMNDEDFV